MPIRWGDMDAMMHVNNTVYFRYAEQARIEWVESWGHSASGESVESVVVANVACEFLRPLKYPGKVHLRMYVTEPGRTSIPTSFDMRRTDEIASHGEAAPIVARGTALMVWINNATGRPTALPDGVRAKLLASQ